MDIKDFLRACEHGETEKVKKFLSAGIAVDDHDEEHHTALQVSAANAQEDLVKLFLSENADVHKANSCGWTALHHASFHGHTKVCEMLLKSKASVNCRNKFGATPLNVAAAGGHLSTVKLLLEHGAPVAETKVAGQQQFSDCPAPTATAALFCRDAVLRTLLEKQQDRQVATAAVTLDSLWTPLMFAAASGSKPSAQLLTDRGAADPDRLNALNATALDIANACGNPEVRSFLEGKTTVKPRQLQGPPVGNDDEFFDAAREGLVGRIKDILKDGEIADVDTEDGTGATALIIASLCGHVGVVKLLLSHGADIDHQDSVNGWTALMQATFYGNKEVVKLLVDSGADPTIAAWNGCTALDLTTLMEETDTELLRLLAGQTIEAAPPSMSFNPYKAGYFAKRSASTPAMNNVGKSGGDDGKGFKAWLGKMFKRSKPAENRVIPGTNNNNIYVETIEDETAVKLGLDGTVFTLGFSAATTDLSSYTVAPLAPPRMHSQRLKSNTLGANFSIPRGFSANKARSGSAASGGGGRNKRRESLREKTRTDGGKKKHQKKGGRKQVYEVLQSIKLEQYASAFEEQEIDMEAFRGLTDADLKELGVSEKSHRVSILTRTKKM